MPPSVRDCALRLVTRQVDEDVGGLITKYQFRFECFHVLLHCILGFQKKCRSDSNLNRVTGVSLTILQDTVKFKTNV